MRALGNVPLVGPDTMSTGGAATRDRMAAGEMAACGAGAAAIAAAAAVTGAMGEHCWTGAVAAIGPPPPTETGTQPSARVL